MERTQLWATMEEVENDSRDYLQDPQLWLDRLPQPFRMIDDLLQEIFERAWQLVEESARQAVKVKARNRVPEVVVQDVVEGIENVFDLRESKCGNIVFVGCSDGLRALAEENGKLASVAHCGSESAVTFLAVEQADNVHFISACTKRGKSEEQRIFFIVKLLYDYIL